MRQHALVLREPAPAVGLVPVEQRVERIEEASADASASASRRGRSAAARSSLNQRMPNGDSAQYGSGHRQGDLARPHQRPAARLVGLRPAARDRRRRGRGRRRRARPSTPACRARSGRPRAAVAISALEIGHVLGLAGDPGRRHPAQRDLDVEHVPGQAHAADRRVEQVGLDARATPRRSRRCRRGAAAGGRDGRRCRRCGGSCRGRRRRRRRRA